MSQMNVMVSFSSLTINKDLGEGKYGQLTWSIRNGYPRITVFTDKSKVRDNDKFDYNTLIIAPFDYANMLVLLNKAEEVIDGPKDKSKQVACYDTKFQDGVRTNEVYLKATVEIGKDSDGVIYMAVLSDGKKKIKFIITPKDDSKWHKFSENGDVVLDKGIISATYAKAYFAQAKRLIEHRLLKDTIRVRDIEPKKVPTMSGGNSGGNAKIDTPDIDDAEIF
jgi:hypothetical protein